MKKFLVLALPVVFASGSYASSFDVVGNYRCDVFNKVKYSADDLVATTRFEDTEFSDAKDLCVQFMEYTLPGQKGHRNWELNWESSSEEDAIPGYRCEIYDAYRYDRTENLIATYFTAETNQKRAISWCKSLYKSLRPWNSKNWELFWVDAIPHQH